MNFQLETLLDNIPFQQIVPNVQSQLSLLPEAPLPPCLEEAVTPDVIQDSISAPVEVPEHESPLIQLEETLESNASETTAENLSCNVPEHFSEDQVQSVRNTFKVISQKLGFNEPMSFSSVTEFYEKPSTTFMRDLSIKMAQSDKVENISADPDGCDNFQIPEKDLNTASGSAPSIETNLYDQTLSMINSVNDCIKSLQLPIVAEETSGETELETEDFSSNLSEFDDNDSVSLHNAAEPSCSKPKYSAVEKLNNYIHTAQESTFKVEPLKMPDLKLKPAKIETVDIIQNISSAESDTPIKKKMNEEINETGDKTYSKYI